MKENSARKEGGKVGGQKRWVEGKGGGKEGGAGVREG